ncbi:MAG: ketoacyl-ACP synthase III [Saprospiraceae bacterium]|nr:ketoacyl-ACP synthase III [Saprospiraceae bacterium]MBK8298112.1 ketoacyl-ACP synthase III [Saprospiraceae bacterium]
MNNLVYKTVITGTGCFIPPIIKTNRDFTVHDFFDENKNRIETDPAIVVEKFRQITGIEERRYAPTGMNTSDIGTYAAIEALDDSGIDPESLDQIIVAQNFGNVIKHTNQSDMVPSLAARIKHNLKIKNPHCVAYDVLFGCPGWIQGMIQADAFLKARLANKCLVIGAETLSRVIDVYDRDSMIYSDGAGACVVEYREVDAINGSGMLSSASASHCMEEVYFLNLGESYFPNSDPRQRFIKMKGRKIYEFALTYVPAAMKECLDKANAKIQDVKMIFIHQANEKMDEAIIKNLYKLYGINQTPTNTIPMNIHKLGNSSVATVPTLFDTVRKEKLEGFSLEKGDLVLFASVGAGMNINAVCYRM